MSKVKVIRIMEYTFDSYEQMDNHFTYCQVPLRGAKQFGHQPGRITTIRSTIIESPFDNTEEDEVNVEVP